MFTKLFPSLDADIYCLEEVTPLFIDRLEKSKFYKEGFEHTPIDSEKVKAHFPMIISRLPFVTLYNKNRFCICLFEIEGINTIVICAHLIANEDQEYVEIRK